MMFTAVAIAKRSGVNAFRPWPCQLFGETMTLNVNISGIMAILTLRLTTCFLIVNMSIDI